MRISVFGLGYVGCISAACLARDGHQVVGVDVSPTKVDLVQSGQSPVLELGLDALIAEMVAAGRLSATLDWRTAVRDTDVSVVCVGTPSNGNGSLSLEYVEKVGREIGQALADKDSYHVVVIRSTVLPGTVRGKLLPVLEEASGRVAGRDFGLCMNPEFLREGSAIEDYYHPSIVVVGELDSTSGATVEGMYESVEAVTTRVPLETAEMVKYVNNAFHALKIAFANEVGTIASAHGVDPDQVMDIFLQDKRLNISPAYLKPGFAFGGSCLPKDLRALTYRAREVDLECPVLNSILDSNQQQIMRAIHSVEATGRKKIGVLGLSFKAGTDDVRESPSIPLVETLLGRGYQVLVYDRNVKPERLVGANKSYLERELPHIASLMCGSMEELIGAVDVVVVANKSREFRELPGMLRSGQQLIDLVGAVRDGQGLVPLRGIATAEEQRVA